MQVYFEPHDKIMTDSLIDIITANANPKITDHIALAKRLDDAFTTEDQRRFVMHFYLYQRYNQLTDYVINLDDAWPWLGFTQRGHAKRLVLKTCTEGIDYVYGVSSPNGKNPSDTTTNLGGRPKEVLNLNINAFKKLCVMADTEKGKQARSYYVDLEQIVLSTIDEEYENMRKDYEMLKVQNQELQQANEIFKQHLEKDKRLKSKEGYVYIVCSQKELSTSIYKVGQSIDPKKRVSSFNTSESDNAITSLREFKTVNRVLAESIIHSYLKDAGFHYRAEFFQVEYGQLVQVCESVVAFVNVAQNPDVDQRAALTEVTQKLKGIYISAITNYTHDHSSNISDSHDTNTNNNTTNDNSTTNNNVTINVNVVSDGLRFLDEDTYRKFVSEKLRINDGSIVLTKILMETLEQYLNNNQIVPKLPIKGGSKQTYFFDNNFKDEVIKFVESELFIKQRKLKGGTNGRGFRGCELVSQQSAPRTNM